MTSRTFIAVDPGASGGIVWSDRTGVHVRAMPDTRRGCIDVIREIIKSEAEHGTDGEMVAYIEKINGFIPDGGASQMFQFGASVERVGCILETLGVRLVEMTPQAWQKALGLGTKGIEKAKPGMSPAEKSLLKARNQIIKRDWKQKLKSEAERRFPGIKITLKTADALLLLDVAIQLENNRTPTQQPLIP